MYVTAEIGTKAIWAPSPTNQQQVSAVETNHDETKYCLVE
jgi:hypothetical protein